MLAICSSGISSAEDVVHYAKKRKHGFNAAEYEINSYYLSLLKIALEKTKADYGAYRLVPSETAMVNRRAIANLTTNSNVDVVWGEIPVALDSRLDVIDIPLLRRFSDYMSIVIRKEDQKKFSAITTQSQLKLLMAGRIQLANDIDLFKRNGYKFIASTQKHDKLFTLLSHKRIDYFPIIAYGGYLNIHKYPDLMVEQTMALRYKKGVYFIVNAAKPRLKERITKGLRIAEADGSFKRHFDTHSMMKPYQTFSPEKLKIFPLQ